MPRYIIVFAFETSLPNLIRQQKDRLSHQPCRPSSRRTQIISLVGIIFENSVVTVSD